MYKIASRNQQGRAARIDLADMPARPEVMTAAQRYDAGRAAYQRLQELNKLETNPEQRRVNGLRLQEISIELRDLRPRRGRELDAARPLAEFLLQAAREVISPALWQAIQARGERLRAEAVAAANASEETAP